MPYRRLPNTDAARVRALEIVTRQQPLPGTTDCPYTPELKQKIELFLPRFKTAILNSDAAREKQNHNSRVHAEHTRKAKLYISHFLQVLNLAITRGELKPAVRTYYGIDENDPRLPSLATEQDLLQWGEKTIRGEQERLRAGGTPIYSPSIALVRVNHENFKQSHFSQKQFQQNAARYCAEVARVRHYADQLVLDLWNQIEAHHEHIENELQRREACQQYGIAYVFRKTELKRIQQQQRLDQLSPRLPF
ncbi:MAG: hypothetical protein LBG30_02655 [Odoribacteraceae bacterium]|jgi:hypothetical protein|nr:hypothetical protein [Odoribacteraceae bacterium]